MKKNTTLIIFLLVSILSSCNNRQADSLKNDDSSNYVQSSIESTSTKGQNHDVVFWLFDYGNNVNIHNELYTKYLNDSEINIDKYVNGKEENSKPAEILLEFQVDIDGKEMQGNEGYFYNVTLSDGIDTKEVITKNLYAGFTNLKVDTEYTFSVSLAIDDENYESKEVSTFKTDYRAPRFIDCPGVTNFRDIGGWPIGLSKKVKQGLIYRTAAINGDKSLPFGFLDVYKDELQIKTQIDLRREADGAAKTSPYKDALLFNCPMGWDGNIINNYKEQVANVFKILGNKNNYPISFNCSIGTDRTGAIAFLINGLLGVNIKDLQRDYLSSNFGLLGESRDVSAINTYKAFFDSKEGNTLSEKIYKWLVSIGVSQKELDTLIEMMTEVI